MFKLKKPNFMYVLVLVYALIKGSVSIESVLMKFEQDHIELGKPLNISCELQQGIIHGNRKWIGGKTSAILCYNGVSNYPEKYREEQLSDVKYQLTIYNVTWDDINCPYGCRFGFQKAETYVNAVEHNLRHLPAENNIDTTYVKIGNNHSISVKLRNVYPVPSCTVILEFKSKNFNNVNETQNGLLYDVQFSDQSEEPYHLCDHPVNILCYFGKTKYPIEMKHDISCNRSTEGNILLPVGLSLSALIVIIVIIVLAVLRHKRRQRRQLRKNRNLKVEESQSFSDWLRSMFSL